MTTFLAFCRNPACGSVFEAPNIIGGAGVIEAINIKGLGYGPCPICGGIGYIPDGTYTYANEVVKFISGPESSVKTLRSVEALLRKIKGHSLTRSEILDQVKSVSPAVAGVFEKSPDVAITQQWILILIAFITLAIQFQTTYFKASETDVDNLFIEHLQKENEELKRQAKQSETYKRSSPKEKRNDKCRCGSGKKYKHCCGSSG